MTGLIYKKIWTVKYFAAIKGRTDDVLQGGGASRFRRKKGADGAYCQLFRWRRDYCG